MRLVNQQMNATFANLLLHVTKIDTLFTFLHSIAQQKDSRKDIYTGLVERIEHDPNFLKAVITDDES